MNAEPDLERNEAASPHKLDEARKRGQVAKSPDLVTACVIAGAAVWAQTQAWPALIRQFQLDRGLLHTAFDTLGPGGFERWWPLLRSGVLESLSLLLPLFGAIVVAALVGNVAQAGVVISTHPIAPDWTRLNPAQGLRRVFTLRLGYDLLRTLIKLAVIGTTVYLAFTHQARVLRSIGALAPWAQLHAIAAATALLGLQVALGLALVALLDFGYTRREFAHKMRMSRRELKDEHKQREGDPRIRARLRELRREMLKRSLALRRTPQADVLLVNPTHLAVALRYQPGEAEAPTLLCKGSGRVAQGMRRIAARHHIEVVHSPLLARALFAQASVDLPIPPALYPEVARIMVWVLARRAARVATSPSGRAPGRPKPARIPSGDRPAYPPGEGQA